MTTLDVRGGSDPRRLASLVHVSVPRSTDAAPLRVCLVSPGTTLHRIGGMQQHSEDLARGLLAAGHRVTLLTAEIPDGGDPRELPGLASAEWAPVASGLPRTNVRLSDPRWRPESLRTYRRVSSQEPFDVIHSQSSGARGLVDAGVHQVTPVVIAYHGNFYGHVRSMVRAGVSDRRRLYGVARSAKRIVNEARHHYGEGHHRAYRGLESIVVAPSQLRDTVRSQRLDPARTHVVPHGIDVATFHPGRSDERRAAWGIGADEPVVVTLGRLAPDKGNDRAIRALVQLPGARLVVVGGGQEEQALRRLAAEVGVADRVVFAGELPQTEVPDALRAADVFAFPTVRDEAAGLVMLQAMATGLPVVASRSGAVPDYVRTEGEDAVLVPPGDVEALAAALRPLLADPELRRSRGEAGRRHAVEDLSIEAMTAGTLTAYRSAIAHQAAQLRGATAA